MPRGRKPKPAAVKELNGNPGKRKLVVDTAALPPGEAPSPEQMRGAVAAMKVPAAPKTLNALGKKEWERVAFDLSQRGLLRALDMGALENRCRAYSRLVQAQRVLDRKGLTYSLNGLHRKRPEISIVADCEKIIRQYDSEFGMTPAARARVSHVTGDRDQPALPGLDKPPAAKPAPTEPTSMAPPGERPALGDLSDDDFLAGPKH